MCKLQFRNVIGHLHETIFCKNGQGLTSELCDRTIKSTSTANVLGLLALNHENDFHTELFLCLTYMMSTYYKYSF